MDVLWVPANFPFINPAEAAAIMGVNTTTVRRHFQELLKDGLATCQMLGRAAHMEQRWVLTREGLERQFGYLDDVPRWLKEPGLRSLYGMMDQLRALYRIAPGLFDGPGRDWHQAPGTPRLTRCSFILGRSQSGERQGPGLIQAVLSYTHDINISFGWVGDQLAESQIRPRWERRFEGLEVLPGSTYLESLSDGFAQSSGPQWDSAPHLWVCLVLAADDLAMSQAYLNLTGDGGSRPFLFVNARSGACLRKGVVAPGPHAKLEDSEFYDLAPIGDPRKIVQFDGPPHPEDLFGETLPFSTFELVAQWPGLRVKDIARLYRRSRKEVHEITQEMVRREWLQEHGGMLYLGKRGMLFAARRDRVSPNGIQVRVRDAIKQDHKPVGSHRRHTVAVNELMIRLREAGITAFPGWRAILDIPGGTQLKPDLVMFAETPLGRYLYYIEVERTAVHPGQVARKLAPYREAQRMGKFAPAIFITERPEAEALFRRQRRGLPVLTSTLANTKRGPLAGESTVWRHDGQTVPLLPFTWQ